ncbi:MAG: hypothetical protein JSW47_12945, partial [Phycisphaerales bacterium]
LAWVAWASCFLIGLSLAALSTAAAQSTSKLDPALEDAILTEDWEKVVRLLPKEMEPNMPAPLRLVKGHACLATNRNNKSLCLFLGASSEVDLRDWEIWTQTFVRDHPASPIAHYLRGDSCARLQEWDRSLMDFTTGLASDPNHFLMLNSRGVVLALNERWDEARNDLIACQKVAPTFAEGHVSWGTYIVQRRTDCRIALAAFNLALKHSRNHVLALIGKGSMETIIGDLKSAAEHLQQASDLSVGCLSDMGPVVNLNALVLGGRLNEKMEKKIAKATGIEPGMTLDEKMIRFDSLSPSQQQAVVDSVANARHFNGMRAGDILTPDSLNIRSDISGQIGVMGTVPYASVTGSTGLEVGKDISRTTMHNFGQQSAFLDSVSQQHGIRPSAGYNSVGSNIKSFFDNQFGIGRDFSHSGGVSSDAIEDTVDRGDWKTVTVYGMLYTASEEPQRQEGKS